MKGKFMLLPLLILLGAGGTAGYLYQDGYWDTWADKKDALKAEFVAELEGQAPAEVVEPFAECLAAGGSALAAELECPIAAEPALAQQVQDCANAKGAQQDLGMVVVGCLMEVQAKLAP
jgi:hypothetical protein